MPARRRGSQCEIPARSAMIASRRRFLVASGASAVLYGCAGSSRGPESPKPGGEAGGEDEVTPVEDLMREHGVLRRVMYLYDEAGLRLDAQREVPLDAVAACAAVIRRVIEDY